MGSREHGIESSGSIECEQLSDRGTMRLSRKVLPVVSYGKTTYELQKLHMQFVLSTVTLVDQCVSLNKNIGT